MENAPLLDFDLCGVKFDNTDLYHFVIRDNYDEIELTFKVQSGKVKGAIVKAAYEANTEGAYLHATNRTTDETVLDVKNIKRIYSEIMINPDAGMVERFHISLTEAII